MKKISFFAAIIVIVAVVFSCSDNSDSIDTPVNTRIENSNTLSPKSHARAVSAQSLNLEGKIGEIVRGVNVITIDTHPLQANWEEYLASIGIVTSLRDFEILNIPDEGDPSKINYILTAYAADLGTQVGLPVIYDTTTSSYRLAVSADHSFAETITYSCSGCNACRLSITRFPSGHLIQVNCRPGCLSPSHCNKTETVTITN